MYEDTFSHKAFILAVFMYFYDYLVNVFLNQDLLQQHEHIGDIFNLKWCSGLTLLLRFDPLVVILGCRVSESLHIIFFH